MNEKHVQPIQEKTHPRLLHFLKEMLGSVSRKDCRRQFERKVTRLSLMIQPLTDDFHPDGERFCAVSSDLSLKGMAFINPDKLEHNFVKVTFDRLDVSVICQVQHSSSIGIDYPLYLVGVEFLDQYYQS